MRNGSLDLSVTVSSLILETRKGFAWSQNQGAENAVEVPDSSSATADAAVSAHACGVGTRLGNIKNSTCKVVGTGLEMRRYRDRRGTLTFYFITNVLNQKQ